MPPKCSPCPSSPMPPAVSWLAHLSCQSSTLTVSSSPGALHYPCVPSLSLCPSTCSNPLSLLVCKVQLSTYTLQPSSCCISSNSCPTRLAGSRTDPEASCLLGLGCPSICWSLWAASHVSAEWNLCLCQEDLGHMSFPRFSSQRRMAAWEEADGLTATDPVSSSLSQPRAAGTQQNPLPPSSSLAAFVQSLSPELVMVQVHYFSWLSLCEVWLSVIYMWRHCSSQQEKEVVHWGLYSILLL